MATIQTRVTKDGQASYRVMIRLKGRPPEAATFQRKTDAKRWAQQTEAAIREGRYFRTVEARRHTVADLLDRYAAEVLATRSAERRRDTQRHFDWWKDHIGCYLLADCTPALISEHRTKLLRERAVRKLHRSPATVNRYLASLSHAFTVAVREWGWLDDSPLRRVRRLKEPRGRVRFLDDGERARVVEACRQSENWRLYPLVVLALSTGARLGEIQGLRWRDVDLARGVAILHRTKNGERRALPLAGLAAEILRDLAKVRRLDTDLLFANRSGRVVFPRKAWEKALRTAEIEDFRFHDLRHSAASYLAMSGATLAELAEILGHKTLAMVKRYSHLTEQHTSRVVARMNERIFAETDRSAPAARPPQGR